ncbi:ribonuclease H-like domain-containing protein [Tanacetum coccineum]|uniref:Ribonuclease H-like domain-containing protein n=1 Tax=Tanacetum coccineum TaxID=301880 RepID=A0ABQ4XEW5_9ASTR
MMKQSYHEDASDNGTTTNKPKQQQQQLTPTTTTISNIKLLILKKEEYDIWAMEMEHYLEYIDNDVWKYQLRMPNHKSLRSLPQLGPKSGNDNETQTGCETTLSIDDLYNNLRVFEQELTSTSKSSASAQNVAFVSHNKSNTNKVKSGHTGAYNTCTPTSSNNFPEREVPVGFVDEVIYSLFAKQSKDLDLLHEDLEQIDDVDIEEMDINWQIAMIAIRMKKFYKKTGRRVWIDGNKPVGFEKKKLECFKCHNTGHFARECPSKGTNDGKKRDSFYQDQRAGKKEQNQNCLLTMDDGVVNWGEHTVEEEESNHALMAITSNTEGPQKPEVSDSDVNSTEHSTCQSNDSEGSCGNTSEHSSESESESISVPNEMSTSKSITANEKVVSKSKEVEPSCVTHVKTLRKQMKNQETHEVKGKNWNKMMERELGEGYSFIKKKCFVCGSLSHLIKYCDYYEKKMAREAEFKKQRVFNTGNRVAKPVWTNANRVNHANQFVPRSVQLNAGRPNINSVRPNINTGRTNVNSVRPNINSVRQNVNSVRININTVRSKQQVPTNNTNTFSPVRPQGEGHCVVTQDIGLNDMSARGERGRKHGGDVFGRKSGDVFRERSATHKVTEGSGDVIFAQLRSMDFICLTGIKR